jgi:hypothetical protein
MPTNLYFNNFPANITQEQLLIEDLVIESMQINGMDVYYMPRTSRDAVDYLYGEDPLKQFVRAHPIEMYLENVTGMDGEGDFISRFGLEVRDELTVLISRRRFKFTVPNMERPREGDIIYLPFIRNFFEITFVEHENDQAMFHTLGRGRGGNVYLYALKLKQYVFSNEIVSTGVTEIDEQMRGHYAKNRLNLSSVSGRFAEDEIVYQGTDLGNATAQAIVYSFTSNNFVDVYRTQGTFNSGNIIGATSNTVATINTTSDMVVFDNAFEDLIDNNRIEQESEGIVDWSQGNPFGEG